MLTVVVVSAMAGYGTMYMLTMVVSYGSIWYIVHANCGCCQCYGSIWYSTMCMLTMVVVSYGSIWYNVHANCGCCQCYGSIFRPVVCVYSALSKELFYFI
jgi:hypothetical protein